MDAERELGPAELAKKAALTPWAFSRLLKLNYMAPDIITSILDGTQPPSLTKRVLMMTELPMDWALQRRMLGYPERPGFAVSDRNDGGDGTSSSNLPICERSDLRSDRALVV